ncbi:hypothetical protein A0U40_09665 [[Bacillus] sp. KCTC 13219]|nr:hypothetical protein A0U40_09665 [[Bacillus] sp. KCTC 13219]
MFNIAFQEKLKRLRESRKLSMEELANELRQRYSLSINKSTISRWENGAEPKGKDVQYLAHFFNVSPSELIDIGLVDKNMPPNLVPVQPNIVKIPILGAIACGDPIIAEENIEGYTYEFAEYLPHGELFALIAKGDSMEPTIMSGSKVLVRVQSDVENGELAAVLLNGDTEATLKRVKKQDGIILLMPDNTNYEPIIVNKNNPARIIGKIVRSIMDYD